MELERGGGAVVLLQQALHTQVEVPAPVALVLLLILLGPRLNVLLARIPGAVGGPVEVGAVAAVARRERSPAR